MIDLRPLAAYIAGIIDGEGYICVRRQDQQARKHEKSPRFTSRIVVRMCDRGAIGVLEAISGKRARLAGRTKEKWSPIWEWYLYCKQAATLTQAIVPYLTVKRQEAELLLELEKNFASWNSSAKPGHYGFPTIPDRVLAEREDIYRRFREVVEARK